MLVAYLAQFKVLIFIFKGTTLYMTFIQTMGEIVGRQGVKLKGKLDITNQEIERKSIGSLSYK